MPINSHELRAHRNSFTVFTSIFDERQIQTERPKTMNAHKIGTQKIKSIKNVIVRLAN